MTRHHLARKRCGLVVVVSGAVIAVAVSGCGTGGHAGSGSGARASAGAGAGPRQPAVTSPAAPPLAPIGSYQKAVESALADHLRVWIEADLVKRWEEGPNSFAAAVHRVAVLADRPGVAGIKIADELGYKDGMDSAAMIRDFLSDAARALHAAAPGKLLLVDMLVPELGCLPGHQPPGSGPAECDSRQLVRYPQLSLRSVGSYLRMRVINVLDLSADLQTASTYAVWGATAATAETDAWQEADHLGWPALVHLQARKALAFPGSFTGTPSEVAADLHVFVEVPLQNGASAVDIWAWHQEFDGQMYQLMNPGMRPNPLWSGLAQLRRDGDVLFTHMSPSSVESSVSGDLAEIATVFTDIFLPAGTG